MAIKPGKGGVHQRMWYTYILIDPADNSVFYVGKGKGERMNVHVKEARKGKTGHNPRKYQRIREILERGQSVIVRVFSRHFDEDEAFDAEDLLIASLTGPRLTNIAGSRALGRRERCDLLLARMKSFDEWIRTCGDSVLEFATRYSGSPRLHYDRHIAAIKAEGLRIGSSTIYCKVPYSLSRCEQGPIIERFTQKHAPHC